MENLTHTLVGLMLARVGLEKSTPRGTAMMMLAANAPDIDAVFWFGGMQKYSERPMPKSAPLWSSGVVLAPFMTPGSAHRSPADTRVAALSVSSSARGRWKSSGQSSATQ